MEPLEDVLGKVRKLSGDLWANSEEEQGYGQSNYPGTIGDAAFNKLDYDPDGSSWVVTKPAVPDTSKRQAARQKLQQLYDSSEWYSARYLAAKSINLGSECLSKIPLWVSEYKRALDSQDDPTQQRLSKDLKQLYHLLQEGGNTQEQILVGHTIGIKNRKRIHSPPPFKDANQLTILLTAIGACVATAAATWYVVAKLTEYYK